MRINDITERFGSFTLLSEEDFLLRRTNSFDNNVPLVVYGGSNRSEVLSKIKKHYGNPVIEDAGGYIIVAAAPFLDREVYSFGDLVEVIRRLRDKDGCPWDRQQTSMSIRNNAVEEAYELAEAIERNDGAAIMEESGDVLLQGLFNAVIAEDEARFSAADMISALCRKLITRHTHIFGKDKAADSGDALKFWESAKAIEKKQSGIKDKLDAVPRTFGSVMRANKVQKIISKTGFDFQHAEEAYAKVYEELTELKEASNERDMESEGGDLLFSAVNLLRMLHIDQEQALNATTSRFIRRFLYVERRAAEDGRTPEECSLDELDRWYNEGKPFADPL